MAARQGATPPAWLGQSRWRLLGAVIGGWRQNRDKLAHVLALLGALFRPALVRQRLLRLQQQGFIDRLPSIPQLLVAARDQMILNATVETRLFYESQGIPWIFHNLRRFLSGPATMLDPAGLFSPRATIVEHVLQTFHRHPLYDLVLLRAYPGGVEAMAEAADAINAGTHPHQRALTSLIEDGAYHARLPRDIAAFRADPHMSARPIPDGLVPDPAMMLGMDQFKDIRGYTAYAARLEVGLLAAVGAWLAVGFDETLGGLLGVKLARRELRVEACDRDLVARHLGRA